MVNILIQREGDQVIESNNFNAGLEDALVKHWELNLYQH